jgi:hypothetical protein
VDAGKLPRPGRRKAGRGKRTAGARRRRGRGLSPAEIVSELKYNQHTPLAEIAEYDDYQLAWVIFRPRDKYGRLRRKKAPKGRPHPGRVHQAVSFEEMFRSVWRKRGDGEQRIEERWKEFLLQNPKLKAQQPVGAD